MKKILFLLAAISLVACNKPEGNKANAKQPEQGQSKGIGPVQSVTLAGLDAGLAQKGEKLFHEQCSACHKIDERYVGPALKGVTTRRTPEWVMNMIVNPEQMTREDATAKELLGEYMAQMTNQNVVEADARMILEYFRKVDGVK
ncbi:MAG TPA: c-type cytochrome [Turneriella sp.]|nr:c-type cytochrome [Turneriella sp.]